MAIAVLGDIPDSERFVELAETPPAIDLPAAFQSEQASSYVSISTSVPPFRPRRSSQRVKQIFIPASSHEAKINDSERRRTDSIIDLYGSSGAGVVHGGENDDAAEKDQVEEQFYSPLSSPALFGTTQHKNRTSEIPLLASPLNNGIASSHHGNIKEAGVKRAFRSKVGTDGSISLSILPSAAALNEMLELSGSNKHSTTSEILSTYQPATTFTKFASTLNDHSASNGKEDGGAMAATARGVTEYRRPSEANSINTRPLTIKRKKPAIYQPDQGALPVSRAASFDACTPTSEHPPLPTMYIASSPTTTTSQQTSSPRRGSDAAASLPVTQTFQTPLRRIPQSDTSPPATPPTWTGSTRSDTYTEDDSLPVSPRSSRDRQVPPKAIGRNLNGLKLDHGQSQVEETDTAKDVTAPKIIQTTSNEDEESEYPTPLMCDIEDMQDRPGVLRRESDDDSSDMDYDDDDDDDEDDTSDHNFGLESFPVPSANLSSPKNTPRMYPVSPLLGGDGYNHFNPNITASPAQRKASIASSNSRLRPKTDLYPIPTDAEGNQEWDQATELEIRDRVFRAEIKKPSKVDKARRKALQKVFEQLKRPTKLELYEASLYSVRDENGHKVRFGTLFEEKKTIVCFIRHFWCSQCQNYVDAITKVRPEVLAKHNMNLFIVSNGSWKMIKSYRKLLGNKCPYPIYTDRAKHIYTCLGMTLRSWDAGKGPEVGNYIQHSLGGSIIAGIKSGVKLPLKPPGDQQQLGGEFVLGPGLHVTFAHRMKTTRGHAEIEEVLASAGINLEEENKALGIRDDESNNGHLDTNSHKKEKDHRKRSSAIQYSTSGNGGIGSTTMQSTPSLASSILNRLSSPRTAPSIPKRFTTGGSKTGSPVVSQPGSPMASTTHFGNGAGIGNTSPPASPTRARSKRLVKKNRNYAPANGLFADSTTPSSSALGATSSSQSPPLGGLSLSQSMNDLRSRRRNKGGRPLSTSALPESRAFPSLSAYNDAPKFANGIREEEEAVAVPAAAGGPAEAADEEEEFNRIRNSLQNRSRKHSSAPPVIPTPTTVTPLSMGFLQVPTPPASSSSSDLKGVNGSFNKSQQPQQPSFFYSSIPNGASTTSVNGNGKANGRTSSSESVSKVTITQPLQTRSQPAADLKHRYSASALPPREKADEKYHHNGNNGGPNANGYLGVHTHEDGLHSEDVRPTSSRFSESSGDEEATCNKSKNSKKKKNLSSSSTKRSSAGTSSTLSGSRPRSFVRSLTLRSSSSSLSAANSRPVIVRLDSK